MSGVSAVHGTPDECHDDPHRAHLVTALAVKAAEEDRAHSDGGVAAESGEEAATLEGDVASADDAGLARRLEGWSAGTFGPGRGGWSASKQMVAK